MPETSSHSANFRAAEPDGLPHRDGDKPAVAEVLVQPSPPAPLAPDLSPLLFWWLFGLVFLIAALLRFPDIARCEMWTDECVSIFRATTPEGVMHHLRYDYNAPVYYYLLKPWIACFGLGYGAVRSLSAVCGMGFIVLLGLWLRAWGVPRQAVLWTVLLAALTPVEIYYSQEARSYTLMNLLLVASLWLFTRAARSGKPVHWALFSALLLLALYTHTVLVFVVPAFLVAGLLLRFPFAQWRALLISMTVVGCFYVPWLSISMSHKMTNDFIVPLWKELPPALAIPRSFEAFGIGGLLPKHLRFPSPAIPGTRVVSVLWLALCALAAVFAAAKGLYARRASEPSRSGADVTLRGQALFAAIFMLVPLLLLFLYSATRKPMYMVGRYDMLAHPGYLVLVGVGIHVIQTKLARLHSLLALAPLVLVAALSAAALLPRFAVIPPNEIQHPSALRMEIVRQNSSPDDLVVCVGTECVKMLYQKQRLGVSTAMIGYPIWQMDHPFFLDLDLMLSQQDALKRDAQQTVSAFVRAKGAGRRMWIMLDSNYHTVRPGQPAYGYRIICDLLMNEANAKLKRWYPADPPHKQLFEVLDMAVFVSPGEK